MNAEVVTLCQDLDIITAGGRRMEKKGSYSISTLCHAKQYDQESYRTNHP